MAAAAVDTVPVQSPSPSDVKPNSVTNSVPSELVEFPHYRELQRYAQFEALRAPCFIFFVCGGLTHC